jgi:streptogramin lyase
VGNTPTTAFFGSLLLPDGRVFFVPSAGTAFGFFNPVTGLYTSTPATFVATGLRGAVLVPNGNVVMIPWGTSSNVVVLNPISLVSSNIVTSVAVPNDYQGGVLRQTGNVIMCPVAAGNIGLVNPTTMTYINVGPTYASTFSGAVLLPNGNVFFGGQNGSNSAIYNAACVATVSSSTTLGGNFTNIYTGGQSLQSVFLAPNGNVIGLPYSGQNIVSVNPTTFTSSNVACGASLMGGAMLPSGNLICTPSSSANVGMFDTVALTFSNVAGSATGQVSGATLYPDGRVFFAPSLGNVGCMSTMVPVDPAFCLSPYFNKF